MKIIPIDRHRIMIYQQEDNEIVAYLCEDGHIVDRWVVAEVPMPQPNVYPVAFEALLKAGLATITIIAIMAGHLDIALVALTTLCELLGLKRSE
jgi:hypothetical protein